MLEYKRTFYLSGHRLQYRWEKGHLGSNKAGERLRVVAKAFSKTAKLFHGGVAVQGEWGPKQCHFCGAGDAKTGHIARDEERNQQNETRHHWLWVDLWIS